MDVCVRDQPAFVPVSGGEGHLSACWLPPDAVGVDPASDGARRRFVEGRRGPAIARLRSAISGARAGGGVANG
jgi:hypothetical protein